MILNLIAMIILYVRIDKKKKLLVTTFLQAFGIAREEIIPLFYNFDKIYFKKDEFFRNVDDILLVNVLKKVCCC